MKRLLIVIFSVFTLSASAIVPDDNLILAAISEPASSYYYPNLMIRYKEGRPITTDEFFYLYYGYTFQETYKPLNNNPKLDRVMEIMSRLKIDTPSTRDIEELIAAGKEAMDYDPFSPKLLNIMSYAYGALGDKIHEKIYADHMDAVFRTIESTGDGLKNKTPMHIIFFSHALDYIASKGWVNLKARIISREVEFIPFDFPHKKVKGLYFDYSRIYKNKPEGYVFKRERTWQFNNLKPRPYK